MVRGRLAAQMISTDSRESPASIVRWMTAMQAQDVASVTWSIGLRNPVLTRSDVDDAFLNGSIVRSWPMRGTLHAVAPEEVYHVFEKAGVDTTGQRGYHTLWYLAQTSTLCLGPPSGSRATFALLDEWVPTSRTLERDEALGEFVFRYFRSHGPASIRDFARWSSTTLTEARLGLSVVQDQLDSVDRDGDILYFAAGISLELPRDRIRLLPGFDEYLLGYQDRSPQLSPDRASDIVPGGNGVFRGTIVDDGIVVGSWKRASPRKGQLQLKVQPFSTASARLNGGIAREECAYAAFFDGTRNPNH